MKTFYNDMKKIIKKYRDGKCTVREQMLVRIGIGLVLAMGLYILDATMGFIVWIYPYIDSITFVVGVGVMLYTLTYIFWYMEIWSYGGVESDARKNYPYIQNAVFIVVSDIYTALKVIKPPSKNAVASIGQKTFNRGEKVVYQFDLLLKDASEMINVDDVKEILQNELVRKSEEGFDGIVFDAKGFPYLCVDSVLKNGSYLQVQIIVFWNEEERNHYEEEKEKRQVVDWNTVEIEDEVF